MLAGLRAQQSLRVVDVLRYHPSLLAAPCVVSMSAVKKGFLGKKKAAKVGSARVTALVEAGLEKDAMHDDSRSHFGFLFPIHSNPWEIYALTCQFVRDLLGNFTLEVLGTAVADGVSVVCVEFHTSQTDALDAAVFEKRDSFVFAGSYLSAAKIDDASMFKIPLDPTSSLASGSASSGALAQDLGGGGLGLVGSAGGGGGPGGRPVVDRVGSTETFYTSPMRATQRSSLVHSGLTPELENQRQTLDDFLALESSVTPLVVPPLPGASADPTMQAILEGVNELRRTSVTKATLAEFRALQSAEMRTFVRAETVPLHNAVGLITQDVGRLAQESIQQFDRVGHLETRADRVEQRLESGVSAPVGPNPHDIALRRVAFVGFPPESSVKERIAAMESFMRKHFSDVRYGMVSLFPDKEGNDTVHGFVEVADRKVAKRVTGAVKSRSLKVDGFGGVVVKPAQTAIDGNRNWALRTADRLIREHPGSSGRLIETKRAKDRGIYVDGVQVFSQEPRYSRNGSFHGAFSGLKLPE